MFKQNALLNCDSYKLSHQFMFPEGMTKGYSNFTPRSMDYFNSSLPKEFHTDSIVFFGIQGFLHELKECWDESFFNRPKEEVLSEYKKFVEPFAGNIPTDRIATLHDIGYLPLEIKALPEGSLVPKGVPVLTITNTHPEMYWLPNYLETWLSAELWKSSTSATRAVVYRKILKKYQQLTGSPEFFIQFQSHDFSLRGMSGISDGAKSGSGHLAAGFTGTDNLPAVMYLNQFYRGKETFVGCSVPASEHSVTTAGGMKDELQTLSRFLDLYPSGVVSIVSDSYDYWKVLSEYSVTLKDKIMNRIPDANGLAKTVFRPDSGDPVEIVCGVEIIKPNPKYATTLNEAAKWCVGMLEFRVENETPHGEAGDSYPECFMEWEGKIYKVVADIDWNRYDKQYYYVDGSELASCTEVELTPEQKGSVQTLWDIFGGTVNEKGYKTLDQHVGLIYGDSITPERANEILKRLAEKGFASDNIVFGVGSYTYQHVTRDTCGFAMKMTYAVVDGKGIEIFKDPKTDSGTKKSAKGLLCVVTEESTGKYKVMDRVTPEQEKTQGELRVVFKDGTILINDSIEEIRNRVSSKL